MEQRELNQWKAKRDMKIATLEVQVKKKRELEMAGLMKRIASGREEQKQARKSELDRLLQRYHNVKQQLGSVQKISVKRSDAYPGSAAMTPSLLGTSRPGIA